MTKFVLYSFIVQSLFCSLALSHSSEAQVKKLKEIYLEVSFSQSSLEEAFNVIEQKTEFDFAYIAEDLPQNKVSLNFKKRNLEDILLSIAEQSGVSFKRVKTTIHVKNSTESQNKLEEILEVNTQTRNITGKVTSYEDGEGLPGVNVVEKGTSNGTVTDVQGNYSLEVSEGATLVFSSVGYTQEEVEVGNRSTVDLTMTQDIQQLQELVVVGFGTQEKRELTGSVVRANIDDFRESPNVNIAQSLQGTVPGLNIGQVDEAGENPQISIRGQTTLGGNQDVLIVLDGIIFTGNLSDLNPNDIASIDVLKDASSMAIYGSQAANGVILITSKEGKRSDKPIFNYTGSYTTQSAIESLTVMGPEAYLQKVRDRHWQESFLAPDFTQPNPDFEVSDFIESPEIIEGLNNGTNYSWWDNLTRPGLINSHNLSVSGNQSTFSYFLAGGYTKQKGIILNDEFERITARINLSNNIFEWFKIGAQTFGSFSDFSGESPQLQSTILLPPLVTPYNEDGELNINPTGVALSNPFIPTLSDDFDKRNSLFANFYADIDLPFIKGLNYRVNFGNNYTWERNYRSNIYQGSTTVGGAFKRFENQYDWTLDNILTYKKSFAEKHSVNLTLVAGRRELRADSTGAEGVNYPTLQLSYNDLSLGAIQQIGSAGWDESFLYQMARINYEFDYKYLITGTVRRDGFSGFAANNKTAIFPSIGLGWIISEESFMDLEEINNLKIRASYGTNGNLALRYSSLARLGLYPAYVNGDGGSTLFGKQVNSLANNDLTWETTTGLNLGLDFALFNNRISGAIDYYNTTTRDLIFPVVIPEITGFSEIISNVGEIANRGIELMLNADIVRNDNFSWNINFNIASNQNEIKSLIGQDANQDGIEDDLVSSNLFIGESINSIYYYETNGMYQLDDTDIPNGFLVGTYSIIDQNDDDFIDPLDRVIIGREEPAYRFGILNRFNYKNFELRFFVNSVQGGRNGYLGENRPSLSMPNGIMNAFNEFDYWTPSNPNARYRQLLETPSIDYVPYQNRSFIRLQDVNLSYTFSNDLITNLGLSNAKVFISGKNLLTITDWVGWDPETGVGLDVNGRPVLRGYSLGIDLSF